MDMTEQRQAVRHQCSLPLEIGEHKFSTRDFSTSGVFFETDRSFCPGQAIEFTIVLEHVEPGQTVRLKCQGEIVRVETNKGKIGVAAVISSYGF